MSQIGLAGWLFLWLLSAITQAHDVHTMAVPVARRAPHSRDSRSRGPVAPARQFGAQASGVHARWHALIPERNPVALRAS
jgi:hypothetical protein